MTSGIPAMRAENTSFDWPIRGSCAAQAHVDMQLQGKLVKLR